MGNATKIAAVIVLSALGAGCQSTALSAPPDTTTTTAPPTWESLCATDLPAAQQAVGTYVLDPSDFNRGYAKYELQNLLTDAGTLGIPAATTGAANVDASQADQVLPPFVDLCKSARLPTGSYQPPPTS